MSAASVAGSAAPLSESTPEGRSTATICIEGRDFFASRTRFMMSLMAPLIGRSLPVPNMASTTTSADDSARCKSAYFFVVLSQYDAYDALFDQLEIFIAVFSFRRKVDADPGPPVAQVACSYQPIAAVVAGARQNEDIAPRHVSGEAMYVPCDGQSGMLHKHARRHARFIGAAFEVDHLICGHYFHCASPITEAMARSRECDRLMERSRKPSSLALRLA